MESKKKDTFAGKVQEYMLFTKEIEEVYAVMTIKVENFNAIIAPEVKAEFVNTRNEGIRHLILDLNQVQYIDSSGLSTILTAHRIYKGYGSFLITGVKSSSVKKLIEISRLDTILTIIPTLSEAKDYAQMEEFQRQLMEEE